MKIRITVVGQAASALLVCALVAGSAHADTVSSATNNSLHRLVTGSKTPVTTHPDLTDLTVTVKVFKVFGDDDSGGDGSSKAGSRPRTRGRSTQKRSRNSRKAPPAVQTVDQPAGILLLLDPSFCDQIKM